MDGFRGLWIWGVLGYSRDTIDGIYVIVVYVLCFWYRCGYSYCLVLLGGTTGGGRPGSREVVQNHLPALYSCCTSHIEGGRCAAGESTLR